MNRYKLRALKLLLRFRNRRGFGVHAPFAFSLITEVIRPCRSVSDLPERLAEYTGWRVFFSDEPAGSREEPYLVFVAGIRDSATALANWKRLASTRGVVIDGLGWGLVVYNDRLQPGIYYV